MKLKFKNANGKLKKMAQQLGVKLKTFTLPAGYTCPGAKDCLAFADRKTGKIKDGSETEFRCFMASLEATFPSLREMVWDNLTSIRSALKNGVDACADLICESLPKKFDVMRVHVGGDYFSREYLMAWIEVAKRNPDKVFYSYSKSLHFMAEFALPENLVLTASRGGKHDNLIANKYAHKFEGKRGALIPALADKLAARRLRHCVSKPYVRQLSVQNLDHVHSIGTISAEKPDSDYRNRETL